ncbi:MAG: class IV adenylate cyclase [Pyrinomonadaceae bacterium]|nr:class IV adenylate cyclase [Pyrinomonadaceae bacterium]
MAVELEKKYRLTEAQRSEVLAAMEEFGAEYLGEEFEENIICGSESLIERNAVIRVRKTDCRTLLTFKQRMPGISDIKHQIEEETEIEDGDAMLRILSSIGIEPQLVYEKRRRTWRFRDVELVIDELPFGLYMEIEGSLTAIREAEMLMLAEDFEAEPETYPRLTARLGKRTGSIIESRF